MSATTQVQATIPTVEFDLLRTFAHANDRTVSREIRRAIHYYLRDYVPTAPPSAPTPAQL